jgi:GTPase SAR1 family protein
MAEYKFFLLGERGVGKSCFIDVVYRGYYSIDYHPTTKDDESNVLFDTNKGYINVKVIEKINDSSPNSLNGESGESGNKYDGCIIVIDKIDQLDKFNFIPEDKRIVLKNKSDLPDLSGCKPDESQPGKSGAGKMYTEISVYKDDREKLMKIFESLLNKINKNDDIVIYEVIDTFYYSGK